MFPFVIKELWCLWFLGPLVQNKKHQLEVLLSGAVLQHLRRTMHGPHCKLSVTEENGVWEVLNESWIHLGALAVYWVWSIICPRWCSSKGMVCTRSLLSLDVFNCNWTVALRACRDYSRWWWVMDFAAGLS